MCYYSPLNISSCSSVKAAFDTMGHHFFRRKSEGWAAKLSEIDNERTKLNDYNRHQGGWALFCRSNCSPWQQRESDNYIQGPSMPTRFLLLTCSVWLHWAPGTAGNAACTREKAGAADSAQARLLFSDSNILSAMLRIEHLITYRLSYMVRNKRGLA